jgi:hypothetical protein
MSLNMLAPARRWLWRAAAEMAPMDVVYAREQASINEKRTVDFVCEASISHRWLPR